MQSKNNNHLELLYSQISCTIKQQGFWRYIRRSECGSILDPYNSQTYLSILPTRWTVNEPNKWSVQTCLAETKGSVRSYNYRGEVNTHTDQHRRHEERVFDDWILLRASVCPEALLWWCCSVWTCCLSLNPRSLCRRKPAALFGNMAHRIRWLAAALDNPDKVSHKKGQIKRVYCARHQTNLRVFTLKLGIHWVKKMLWNDLTSPDAHGFFILPELMLMLAVHAQGKDAYTFTRADGCFSDGPTLDQQLNL